MREADQAAGETKDTQAPGWLRDAVAGVWRAADWARWETRVVPALEARGVTVEMVQPLRGVDGELVGIGVRSPEVGWRVGWLGDRLPRRRAVLHAASELLREIDAPGTGRKRDRIDGGWLRGR